jgi:16S rRNA (adenine1518-N6/adenine1519-N6)-dimethyltransferase
MSLLSLPSVREMAERHDLLARKSLGQHFLFDLNVTRKIARLAGPLDGRRVMEVGPGPGGLTRALLEEGAHVIAVETDGRFLPALEEIAAAADGRLEILHADALKVDAGALGLTAIVSNLPYNVGTPLLVNWLTAEPPPAQSLTLMFQKEVAERIVASPSTGKADGKDYGRLAVLAAARARAHIVMQVPARAFVPPPRVDSAVVRLDMLPEGERFMDTGALEAVTRAAFAQRRKTIRNGLASLGVDPLALLAEAGIDPGLRPEQVPPEGFMALAGVYRQIRPATRA